jgi:hypothetical protein
LKRNAFSEQGNRPHPTTEPIPSFPPEKAHLYFNQQQEKPMIWLLLLLIVMTGIYVNSVRWLLLGLLVMAIKAFPQVVLPSLAALIAWTIKISLRR